MNHHGRIRSFFLGLTVMGTALLTGCYHNRPPAEAQMLRERVIPPALPTSQPSSAPTKGITRRKALPLKGKITLEDAIQIALANNHTLQLARQDVNIASKAVYTAAALFLPHVSASYGYDIRDREVQAGFGGMTFPTAEKEFQRAELKIQMMICDFGRTLGKYEQALLAKQIADLRCKRIEQTVTYQVIRAYFNVLRALKFARVARDAVKQAQSHLAIAKSLYRNGVVDKNDVLRAEVHLAEVRQRLISAENAVKLATSSLNSVMGINVNYPTEVVDITTPPKCDTDLLAALQKAVAHRPELVIVQKYIQLEQAGIMSARGELLPKIYVSGSLNRLDDKYQVHKNSAIMELGISMDIFAGGRRIAEYQIAKMRRRKAVENAKQVCDGIALEVKQATLAVIEAKKRLIVAKKAVAQAAENLRLMQKKYKQATATATDLLDAEILSTRTQNNYYATLYDLIVAIKRLEFATGTISQFGLAAAEKQKPQHKDTQPEKIKQSGSVGNKSTLPEKEKAR